MSANPVTVSTVTLSNELVYMGTPVLHYAIHFPQFSSPHFSEAIRNMNRYHKDRAWSYAIYISTVLARNAVADYQYNTEHGYPIREYEAIMQYKVTLNEDCTVSLYTEQYEYTGGAHGSTLRTSNTWDLQTGKQIPLKALFPGNAHYANDLKAAINTEIARQIADGAGFYFDNCPQLVAQTFNPKNYYLTPGHLNVYFQQYDIAPYASGLPEFSFTYDSVGATPPACR